MVTPELKSPTQKSHENGFNDITFGPACRNVALVSAVSMAGVLAAVYHAARGEVGSAWGSLTAVAYLGTIFRRCYPAAAAEIEGK